MCVAVCRCVSLCVVVCRCVLLSRPKRPKKNATQAQKDEHKELEAAKNAWLAAIPSSHGQVAFEEYEKSEDYGNPFAPAFEGGKKIKAVVCLDYGGIMSGKSQFPIGGKKGNTLPSICQAGD